MPDLLHDHAADWIAAALADGLTPAERRALDAHLTGCASCRALQTELTATHEMLSQDFPSAVGPLPGFETRLLAGFRRRREQGVAGGRLRTLLAGLLRLPGLRVAGVAATLLALVGLGQMLTGGRHAMRARMIVNDSRIVDGAIDQSKIENNKTALEHKVDTKSFFKQRGDNGSMPALAGNNKRTNDFDGFINYGSPIPPTADAEVLTPNIINQPIFSTRGPSAGGTYTGSTTVNGGALALDSSTASIDAKTNLFGNEKTTKDKVIRRESIAPEVFADSGSTGTINTGRDVTALFGDTRVPVRIPDPVFLSTHDTQATSDSYRRLAQNESSKRPSPASIPAPVTAPSGPAVPPSVSATPSPAATPDSRKLIRNASAELEVASFEQTVAALASAAAQDGGFIDTQNSARGANGKLAGTLVVKTLPENLDRFLARLPGFGEVKNQTIKTEDITKAYFDTEARLHNSRRMEDRLLKMLEEVKGKMSEVLTVEKEIARVRGDIEQMQGELKLYDGQVRFATVSLNVYEKDLHQPAAFLLRETASLALAVGDVERTAADARRLAESAHAQILAADVNRAAAGSASATLRLLLAPDTAPAVLAQFKALGRVENYTVQDERVAQNGSANDAGPDSAARNERAPVSLSVNIRHDEQTSRQVSLTLVAPDVGAAFDRARAAATAAGGDITRAETTRADAAHAQASLTVRLPARADAAFLDGLKTLGRVTDLQTRRTAENPDDGPVLVTLTLADAEPPVQQTRVRVRVAEVERRLAEIKTQAAAAGATVENSTFSREGDDSESATLTVRLPLGAYPGFVERVRALGEVKDFAVRRQDRPGDASAPAEIDLQLFREGRVVAETAGVGATVRRTFAQGADALMWSVQMIGVALAFLAPWAALLAVVGAAWWFVRRRRARR